MDTNRHDHLRRKQNFYRGLEAALAESDEEPDEGREASIRALRKPRESAAVANGNAVSKPFRPIWDETIDAPANGALQKFDDAAQHGPPSSSSDRHLPARSKGSAHVETARRSMAEIALPCAAASNNRDPSSLAIPREANGKRKRNGTIKLMPDGQQIFKGLHFYFFPNNDKNPARAMRISKALEFGATWQTELNENVTHAIIDKPMKFDMLLKYLKITTFPSHVIVVSETYPAECISYRAILDAKQLQFHVKGYPPTERSVNSAAMVSTSPSLSDRSLQLKPARKRLKCRQSETPQSTDESASYSRILSSPLQSRETVVQYNCTPREPGSRRMTVSEERFSTEELDRAIQQARDLQHAPLEHEEECYSRPSSSSGADGDKEGCPKPTIRLLKKQKTRFQLMQERFQCMHKHTGDQRSNPNAATVNILQQMADYYSDVGDEWRARAYRKAIATLRNHPTKVWTKEEALSLPQIGKRLAAKIEEIAFTNRLRRLENARAEPTDQTLQTFMKVYGAGFAKASEWVRQGHKTLSELLEKADLTANQRIGIEHYENFNARIPRTEVELHGHVIRKALHKVDPTFQVIIGGSYRRGANDSGDIDCLITRPNTGSAHLRAVVFARLVPQLMKRGFLVASLTSTNRDDGGQWHGASCLPGSAIWRRLDLLLVPSDEIGAALIYFTGNDIFNRSLRLLASKKGMRLNQRGLYKHVIRGKRREKVTEGTLVEGEDEKKIFEILGVPWRPPEHRIC